MTDPSGARLPRGKVTVLVSPRILCSIRIQNHFVWRNVIFILQCLGGRVSRRRSEAAHQSRLLPSVSPVAVSTSSLRHPNSRRWSITSGDTTSEEDSHGRMTNRSHSVGHRRGRGDALIDFLSQSSTVGTVESSGMCKSQEYATKRFVRNRQNAAWHNHSVPNRLRRKQYRSSSTLFAARFHNGTC